MASRLFRTVAECKKCYVLGNSRYDADMYRRIGLHWTREQSE